MSGTGHIIPGSILDIAHSYITLKYPSSVAVAVLFRIHPGKFGLPDAASAYHACISPREGKVRMYPYM